MPLSFEPVLRGTVLPGVVTTILLGVALVDDVFVTMLKLAVAPSGRAAMELNVNVAVELAPAAVERTLPSPPTKLSTPMPWVLEAASLTFKVLVPVKVRAVPLVPLRLPLVLSPT